MKVFRVSKIGKIQIAVLLTTLIAIALYSGRKALGLWAGSSAKASDPQLFGINLATTAGAFLLTLVTLGALGVAWYLLVEWFTRVEIGQKGLYVRAPGYRLVYRWEEIASLETIGDMSDDAPLVVKFKTIEGKDARATVVDNRPLAGWYRLLYPQVRRPERLLLYPALEDRAALLDEIAARLPRS